MSNAVTYHVIHETAYRYAGPVQLSRQLVRLRPRNTPWQECSWHVIRVEPEVAEWSEMDDFFGNTVVQFALQAPHERLVVEVESHVVVQHRQLALTPEQTTPWERVRDWLHGENGGSALDPAQYLYASPHVPVLRSLAEYARPSFPAGRPLLEGVLDFTARIFKDFRFDPTATTVSTPVETVLKNKRGVCQDFTHLQIACLRSLGLAARYVSGYLLTKPPPGKPRMIGADASHAWVSVFCPELGWVDVDPTNNLLVNQDHVTVAWGRDFSDISPMRGVIFGGGGDHELDVRVTVAPEGEELVDPRTL